MLLHPGLSSLSEHKVSLRSSHEVCHAATAIRESWTPDVPAADISWLVAVHGNGQRPIDA